VDAIDQLVAVEEIRKLKARYFRCMDTKDWDGYAAVFAPDAVLDVTGERGGVGDDEPADAWIIHGNEQIAAFVRSQVGDVLTVHHGHMPEIEVTGDDSATGIWAMEDILRWPPGGILGGLHGWGHYHETYTRIDGRWHIQTCTLTRLRVDYEKPA
jgi:hypothetical protein